MAFVLYFFIAGSGLMYYILKFDTHQTKRMNKLYKENEELKPMFMMKAAERKLKTLSNTLYGSVPPGSYTCEDCMAKIGNDSKQLAARELGQLVTAYTNGNISVKNYNDRLAEMLGTVKSSSHSLSPATK